jgi:predicted Zn-dependent protease
MLITATRESIFVIKVIDVPQAVIALHARFVVLLSRPALMMLSSDELRALLAHEIGHAYVWSDYQRASRARDAARLQDLELVCDVIAIVTLSRLGHDASPLLDSLEKLTRFNHQRFGAADNEGIYPTLTRRKAVIRAIEEQLGSAYRGGVSGGR